MDFFDLHCDTAYRCYGEGVDFSDDSLAVTPEKGRCFEKWYQCFAVFLKDGTENPFEYYKKTINSFKFQLKNKTENLNPIFTVEGGALIQDDLSRVEELYNDGIWALTLTWNGENQIAGGAYGDSGLKEFGRSVINELNRLKMSTDLSHLNKKSFYDSLELSDYPTVTHSALEYVNPHKRNIDDCQLKQLVQKGGIFGLCFYPVFLGRGDLFENIYRNIFHILDLGYENFLSIGSDFDGADMDKKLYDITAVPALYNYLKSRNIGENILKKIFFENAYNFYTKTKGEQKQ